MHNELARGPETGDTAPPERAVRVAGRFIRVHYPRC
jgi:hypothetical protein